MPLSLRSRRVAGALAGAALGLTLPFGWFLVSLLGGGWASAHVYIYMTIAGVAFAGTAGGGAGWLWERIKLLAERDDLTGLFNQNAFLRTASFLLQLGIRHKEPIAFLMMDIDHFKEVNDHHNHLVGSHVLKEIARIIEASTRKSDLTARFGGDEYVFCLPRTGFDDARLVAERIRTAIEARTFTLRTHSVKVTVSLGIAAADGTPGLDVNRLIETADQALYAAKDQGRNRVVSLRFGG